MSATLTEPRRRALQNVAAGNIYRWTLDSTGRTMSKPIWMLDGWWQPLPQRTYEWLYGQGYIQLIDEQGYTGGSQHAELTLLGRSALVNTEGKA